MPASILQVARLLGQLSGWSLSNLEMQKIAFIAEMLHLGREGEPLTREPWQAWAYGPVQPELYHKAKVFGADPVKDIFLCQPVQTATAQKAVTDAYDMMKGFTPGQMVKVTHQPGGAWEKSYVSGAKWRVIPKAAIRSEYDTLIQDDD